MCQSKLFFTREDFYSFKTLSPIFNKRKIDEVIDQTIAVVSNWHVLADEHGVPEMLIDEIEGNLRLGV